MDPFLGASGYLHKDATKASGAKQKRKENKNNIKKKVDKRDHRHTRMSLTSRKE
jgi:hypothetical protein